MARLNGELRALDARLGDPQLYARNPAEAARVAKARADAARSLVEAEEAWLAATAMLEAAAK
jgi:ATP-binding cassette subfamily F protein 3